ncbi:MAG TPA: hypothetical protein VHO24_02515 [Opitutaceae bacterium]|nr:hypothetical protein [Opitutaceae bacterium]
MSSSLTLTTLCASLLLGSSVAFAAKAAPSDITSPEKRRATVELAQRLARPGEAQPLPTELALPFSPAGFEQTDAEERATAMAAASRVAQQAAPKVSSDRDTLERIAAKVIPSGTIFLGGEPTLIFGKKPVKIGTHFTVRSSDGQDYDLELVSIGSTTFTLRLNREEITRPIKPGKSP